MTGPIIRPLVAAALLAIAAPAFASETSEKLVISTSGIDLATYAGQKALEHRVNNAIDRLCESQVFASPNAYALEDCRDDLRAEVQPQVKAVLLRTSVVAQR
jgi:UrcA family protein